MRSDRSRAARKAHTHDRSGEADPASPIVPAHRIPKAWISGTVIPPMSWLLYCKTFGWQVNQLRRLPGQVLGSKREVA